MPAFVVEHFGGTADLDIKSDTIHFIKESNTLFTHGTGMGSRQTLLKL